MNKLLKDGVRELATADELSREQLAALRALMKRPGQNPVGVRARRPRRAAGWVAIAASVVLGLAAGLWLAQPPGTQDLVVELADEIARNHIAAKALDVQASTLADLREPFAVLGFALQELPAGRSPGQLEGGRFCSVQAVPAALLRYRKREEHAGHVTVYQAPNRPERHGRLPDIDRGERPVKVHARGVQVELWTSHGLLFATAQDIAHSDASTDSMGQKP